MTEREKMLAGQLYDPSDEELSHLRKRAFQLVERFNRLQKEDAAAQREILQALLGSMGDHVTFRASVRFDYGCNTFVGDNCYFNFNAVFLDCAPIRIGSNVDVYKRQFLSTYKNSRDSFLGMTNALAMASKKI